MLASPSPSSALERRHRPAVPQPRRGRRAAAARRSAEARAPRARARLYSETPSARSTRPTSVASSRRPRGGHGRDAGVERREEPRRRDVVVLQHARARQRRERVRSSATATAKCRIVTSPRRASASVHGRTRRSRSSSMVSAKISASCPHCAEQVAQQARVVADGVAAMRRRHPLVDDHAGVPRRATWPQIGDVVRLRRSRQGAKRRRPRAARTSSSSSASLNCRQKS